MIKLLLSPTLLLLATLATAQIPRPDSTFGRFGAAWRNIYPTDDQAFGVALRPDGRAVVTGRTTVDSVPQMAVFQYKTDGTLDLDFHWNGKGALTFNTLPSAAHAVVVDAEGRVVLAGYITTAEGEQFGLVRLLPDGTYDPSFGNKGWVTTDFNGGQDQANALAIQPDGRIVAAGFTRKNKDADFALARYLPDGSLDATFGTGGLTTSKIDTLADIIRDIVIQTNGRIVVCGTSVDPLGFNYPAYFATARYTTEGKLDVVFGGTGVSRYDVGGDEESDIARAVALTPTGQIVVAGYSSVSLASKISVVRYRPNGLIDTNFGNLGVAQTAIFANSGNFCTDILALADNSLLLTGMAENVDFKDAFLFKMLENGSPDPSFGQNGKVVRSLSPKDDNAYGITQRPDGRILVVGDTRKDGDFYTDAAVLQFNANGSNDATFGSGGAVVEDLGTSEDLGSAVLVRPDGRIWVGGRAFNDYYFPNSDWILLRFQANGHTDSTFGERGGKIFDFSNDYDGIAEAILQPSGKIVAGGQVGSKPTLMRFDEKGNIDNTFGTNGQVVLPLLGQSSLYSLHQQADGQILAAGVRPDIAGHRGFLFRFSIDGLIDNSFGQNGQVQSSIDFYSWNHVTTLPDGRILIGGTYYGSSNPATVSRFLPNGQPDLSFGQNGTAAFPEPSEINMVAIQKDGKVLLVGSDGILRLNADGSPDLTFGNNGKTVLQGSLTPNLFSVTIQQDGRILLAGQTNEKPENNPSLKNFLVVRLQPDGSLDNQWGENGLLRLRGAGAIKAALDADGNILALGAINNGERFDIVLYRLLRGEYVGTADRPDEAGSRILNVFPNPVSEQLTLEYDLIDNQAVEIKIYSMEGRLIHTLLSGEARFSGKNTERLTLPTSLPAGMYTVAVETKRGSVAVMVVVR